MKAVANAEESLEHKIPYAREPREQESLTISPKLLFKRRLLRNAALPISHLLQPPEIGPRHLMDRPHASLHHRTNKGVFTRRGSLRE
jgi:hypothetical protein